MHFSFGRFWVFAFTILLCAPVFATDSHDRTQFGREIVVAPDEQVGEATCFGCTVLVRGRVSGDVTAFGGSVIVEDQGEIAGDTTAFGGNIHLEKNVTIKGDVTAFGGRVRRDPGATITGDVTSFGGVVWLLLIFGLPLLVLGAFIFLVVWLIRRLMRPAIPATARI